MPCFLVFTLAGPLMAFGDVAPGERRVGVDRPGRSALLGMLAASLGLRREDERQQMLASSLAFAIRVDSPGEALVDYHTTQTAPARRGRRFATRREELAVDDLGTILSQRAYRTDAAFTVAAISVADGPFSLRQIADSLTRPIWPLHVGRRACPLGLPPAAALIEADDVPAALVFYDESEDKIPERATLRRAFRLGARAGAALAAEAAFAERNLLGAARIQRHESRRDEPGSRTRWQFSSRVEIIAHLPG
jgi:CRISPR system Cascade subunit CasD